MNNYDFVYRVSITFVTEIENLSFKSSKLIFVLSFYPMYIYVVVIHTTILKQKSYNHGFL